MEKTENEINNSKKILLGMSGGVDSSVSALLLKNQGYDVIGVTMRLWHDDKLNESCSSESASIDAKRVCDKLNIPHLVFDYEKEFKEKVIDNFVTQYRSGKTPNPCVECNRYLKFGAMLKKAHELGIQYIATGHYAKCEFSQKYNQYVLKKSSSKNKDQSYVLYNIARSVLPYIKFPLGDFNNKSEIRKIAADYNLNVASKTDSQEICFIPDNNHIRFLDENIKEDLSGNIIDANGVILGHHKSFTHYTIGQRRGLGISSDAPLYVTLLNKDTHAVIVGKKESLYKKEIFANDLNFLLFNKLEKEIRVKAKIRYKSNMALATITPSSTEDMVKVVFDEPQRAVTPGQSVVFYTDDDIVIGGGKIM